jgi:hypothetical protein
MRRAAQGGKEKEAEQEIRSATDPLRFPVGLQPTDLIRGEKPGSIVPPHEPVPIGKALQYYASPRQRIYGSRLCRESAGGS